MTNYQDARYQLVPQMRVYDHLRQYFLPYICQSNPRDFRSEVLNTDQLGFRKSHFNNQVIDSTSWFAFESKTLVLGGSVAMSWGATADEYSLASLLSNDLQSASLSLGIMAANSLQEFITGAPFYQDARHILSIGGMNTLYSSISSQLPSFSLYGAFYPVNNHFYESMQRYDFLTLCYLVTDNLNPNAYFKSKDQKSIFRSTLRDRLKRRLKARLFKPQYGHKTEHLCSKYNLERGLEQAIKIQSRDILNIHKLAAERNFLFVIQPYLPILDKVYSEEEKMLKKWSAELLHPEVYSLLYDILPDKWIHYVNELTYFCGRNDIPFIDLNKSDFKGWCFVDSNHLTDHGNKIISHLISQKLLDSSKPLPIK